MSEALPSILEAKERARQHWEADGFYAIVSGVAWTMFGCAIFLSHPPFHLMYGEIGGDVLILAASLLLLSANRITEWLKVRVTYPRTGYVASPQETELQINENAFPPHTRDEMVDTILTATFLLFILGLFLDQRWMIGLFTLLHISLTWYFSHRVHIPWHKKYPPPIMGFLLTMIDIDLKIVGAGLLIFGGVFSVLGGMRDLFFYLTEHPVQRA